MGTVKTASVEKLLLKEISRLDLTYADYRLTRILRIVDHTKKGTLTESRETDSWAAGVRVLKKGAFGFASTNQLTPESLRHIVTRASANAQSAAKLTRSEIELAPLKPRRGSWQTPIRKNPWALTAHKRIEPLLEAEVWLMKQKAIRETRGELDFTRKEIFFGSTEGARLHQTLFRSGGWLRAEASLGSEKIIRTYPGPSGCYRGEGFETVERLAFRSQALRLAEELAELRRSPRSPAGTLDLILKNSILALQVHETFGHGSESDRLYGYEDNFGGRTYLDPGLIDSTEIASPLVSLVSDPRPAQEGGAGTFAFDDEGVPAARRQIIRRGILQGFLSSRETASFLNEPHSSASMIAENGSFMPLIRMTNLNLEPGAATEPGLIQEIEHGLLLDNERSWSVDEIRLGFQIGAECGYRIKKGRIVGMVREPFYYGNSLDFWKSCDGVAGPKDWVLWGFADCRKGAPYQDVFCSHGVAPARFRRVSVGRNV